MQHDIMIGMFKSLKLYGMAHAVGDLAEQNAPAFQAATPVLDGLVKAELSEREVRSVAYQLKSAKFPAYRDLTGFDFKQSMANEALVRQLCNGDFMDTAQNVVLVGGPVGLAGALCYSYWNVAPIQIGQSLLGLGIFVMKNMMSIKPWGARFYTSFLLQKI